MYFSQDPERDGGALLSPPRPPTTDPDAGVIDDARRRQRRRQGPVAILAVAAAVAAITLLSGGGSGGGSRAPHTAGDSWSRASVANGVGVSYPRGWHLFAPPITALTYPQDRLLLTSYATTTGGDCSPTRAENALPATGALIYLLEYAPTPGTVFTHPQGRAFPSRPAAFALRPSDRANYECWTVPAYLIRFRAAGRLFQVQIALGGHTTSARRAQVLRILDSLRFQRVASRRVTTRPPSE